MSLIIRKLFAEPTINDVRETIIKKGRTDSNGNLIYTTEQAHKDTCNVNNIIRKYARTGAIEHIKYIEPTYLDTSGADLKTAMDRVIAIQQKFDKIPAKVRKHFDNDPVKFLNFYNDPNNKDEANKIGLTRSDWLTQPTQTEQTEQPPKE